MDKLFEGRKGKERRDSIGCIEEMWKRKREELEKSKEGEEEVFKRSKKTERSPVKEAERRKEGLENWMREMGGKFQSMMEEVREGFKKQEKMTEMMEEMRREQKRQWSEWEKDRREMKEDLENLRSRIEIIEQKLIQEERRKEKKRRREGGK